MNHMRYAVAGLLTVIAACSASGAVDEPKPGVGDPQGDGGLPIEPGPPNDAAPEVDLDAERPLACGDAGFCETRLPKSELGLPLSLQSVWVVASSDVWSVSTEGVVLHYDGASWKPDHRANHALSTVWASPTSVWAGGEAGLLLHRSADGEWTRVETGHTSRIRAISGTSDADVWFASDDGLVDHFDGTTLRAYPIDISGMRITTVFGRSGLGSYAAGYVEGLPVTPDADGIVNVRPYVMELLPAGASIFNAELCDQMGFVPVSAEVADASSEDDKIFLAGFEYRVSGADTYMATQKFGALGRGGQVTLRGVDYPYAPGMPVLRFVGVSEPAPRIAMWAKSSNDVLMSFVEEYLRLLLWRWDGHEQTHRSVSMGYGFVPRAILGAHGNATDTWLVGYGFALRGVAP